MHSATSRALDSGGSGSGDSGGSGGSGGSGSGSGSGGGGGPTDAADGRTPGRRNWPEV
ncbi:hypothetical protein [Microbacterium sp. A20]|uniref:hypothetical protein n=1 Tax=Microbacterium sp. A20 TaxID=2305450 RepID=UPI00197C7B72|nr:hypothetical protein [Microbacterium sp. A20]